MATMRIFSAQESKLSSLFYFKVRLLETEVAESETIIVPPTSEFFELIKELKTEKSQMKSAHMNREDFFLGFLIKKSQMQLLIKKFQAFVEEIETIHDLIALLKMAIHQRRVIAIWAVYKRRPSETAQARAKRLKRRRQ
jgi:hypothetical protein